MTQDIVNSDPNFWMEFSTTPTFGWNFPQPQLLDGIFHKFGGNDFLQSQWLI